MVDLKYSSGARRWLMPLAVGALVLGAMAVAACGGDDDDDTAPTPTAGTSASPAATTSSSPAATKAAAAYPVKVTDLAKRSVEIKAKPVAVVALSPSAGEFVYAAGGTLVGRASSVKYPEAALQAKEVGTAYQPNFETILSLKPDLIVADSVIHTAPNFKKPLEDLGIPVIFAGAENFQNVIDSLKLVGVVFDGTKKTDELITAINKARDEAKAAIAAKKPSALVLISDRDQVLYAAKSNSYAGDILTQLGFTNPAATQPDAGAFPGYTAVPAEKMLEFNPDFIFTVSPAPEPAPRLSALFKQIPPFKGLKAVTGNKVVELNADWMLQAPGPRIIEAMRAIAQAVTAP